MMKTLNIGLNKIENWLLNYPQLKMRSDKGGVAGILIIEMKMNMYIWK